MTLSIKKNKVVKCFVPDRVVIIGCGGIGSNLWDLIAHQTYYTGKLIREGAHLSMCKRVLLVDADSVEAKNLFRQSFFTKHIGMGKAEALADKYYRQLKEVGVVVEHKRAWLDKDSDWMNEYDMVMLAVDNNASRKILNDKISPKRMDHFTNIVAINGGNTDSLATVQLMLKVDGEIRTASFEHMHPEITNPEDKHPTDQECTTSSGMINDPQTFRANQHASDIMFNIFQNILEARDIDYSMVWADVGKMEFAKDPIPEKEVIIE